MEDQDIIGLFWHRSENAIMETDRKYGKLCFQTAFRILCSREDSEECVSDTYLRAWEAIPPQKPDVLPAFLCRITRNLALNRYEKSNAAKRGRGMVPVALEELSECIPDPNTMDTGSGQPDAWVTAESVPGFAFDGGPKGVPPAVLGACICSGNCQAAGNQRK